MSYERFSRRCRGITSKMSGDKPYFRVISGLPLRSEFRSIFAPPVGHFWPLSRWSDMSPSTGIRGPCRSPWFGLSDNPENLRLLRDLNSSENDGIRTGGQDDSLLSQLRLDCLLRILLNPISSERISPDRRSLEDVGGIYAHTYIHFLIMYVCNKSV